MHAENIGFEPMMSWFIAKFKLTTLNLSVNSLLILSRLELEYHSYQECALPVKLKN